MSRDLPDSTVNKCIFLDACGAHFLERFKKNQSKDDIHNNILANGLSLLLILAEPNALVNFEEKPIGPSIHFLDTPTLFSSGISDYLKPNLDNIGQTGMLAKAQADIDSRIAFHLNALGVSLAICFQHFGQLEDMAGALLFQRKAIQLTPSSHIDMPTYLCELGTSLRQLFSRTRDVIDISEAISFQKKAIQLTPEDHPSMPTYFCSLGTALQRRFLYTGELADISEAISLQRNAVQLAQVDHSSLPACLSELATSLLHKFSRAEELTDVSDAISFLQEAIQLTPEGHLALPTYLFELGTALQRRFSHTGIFNDIFESISLLGNTIQLTPEGHPSMSTYFTSLATSLRLRFSQTAELEDISKAISFLQEAVQLTAENDANLPTRLSDLITSLLNRFSSTGDLLDISKAVSLQKKAVQLIPEGAGYTMPVYVADLENSLKTRFTFTGELGDDHDYEATSFEQRVLNLSSNGQSDVAQFLSLLALSLSHRLDHTRDTADTFMAVSKHYFASAESASASSSDRLNAIAAVSMRDRVAFSPRYNPSQLLGAHQAAVQLISHVAGLERTLDKRRNNLLDISAVSSSAAAFAFASEEVEMALEWLEQGRCLVWSQLNNLVDVNPLEAILSYDPDTADEIMKISQRLVNAGSQGFSSLSVSEANAVRKSSLQEEVVAHLKLTHKWDRLLTRVRSIPDFEDFMKSTPTWSLLDGLPKAGIVIVINVHRDRCDALALRSGIEPLHIGLPEFSYSKAEGLRDSLKAHLRVAGVRMRESKPEVVTRGMRYEGTSVSRILSTLWVTIVKPILNGLGYTVSIPIHSYITK